MLINCDSKLNCPHCAMGVVDRKIPSRYHDAIYSPYSYFQIVLIQVKGLMSQTSFRVERCNLSVSMTINVPKNTQRVKNCPVPFHRYLSVHMILWKHSLTYEGKLNSSQYLPILLIQLNSFQNFKSFSKCTFHMFLKRHMMSLLNFNVFWRRCCLIWKFA